MSLRAEATAPDAIGELRASAEGSRHRNTGLGTALCGLVVALSPAWAWSTGSTFAYFSQGSGFSLWTRGPSSFGEPGSLEGSGLVSLKVYRAQVSTRWFPGPWSLWLPA